VIEILGGVAIVLALLWFARALIYFPDSQVPDVTAAGLPPRSR
jgi:hypothetical protein